MVFGTRICLGKKLANLPSKYGNNQYYKGTGGTKEGWLTSKGRFIRDLTKMKFVMSPGDLRNFALKPYVVPRSKLPANLSESEQVTARKFYASKMRKFEYH